MEGGRKKRIRLGCLVVAVLAAGFAWWFYGDLIRHFAPTVWASIFPTKKQDYHGDSTANLQAMRTALLGYEESEGLFPEAAGWMEAIENRLSTDVLKKGEGEKKLIHPSLVGQTGKYGYAFNESLSAQYEGDIEDKKTILVFESRETARNAHGDPKLAGKAGGLAITLDGQVVVQK